MGFISYSLKYYNSELHKLESCISTAETIYKAQQLLKMLDDLVDEGYTELYVKLEESCQGVSRLRKYLKDNNAEPLKLSVKTVKETNVSYEQENLELTEAINAVIENANNAKDKSDDIFLQELICFCKWIGYEKDTAYIFLLRDTMLPYIYYKSKNRNGIYPWLLGRKTLETLTGKNGVDDYIRAPIINALEFGECKSYNEFCDFVLPDIRKTLSSYPEIENCLTKLLKEIKEKHIIVVESGCYGTFPMLLMSLDNRVDMRMYTTIPYLTDIYADKIFTPKYEKNREFETLYSQNLYFRFSDLNNKYFYVNKCKNKEVKEKTISEIKTMLE